MSITPSRKASVATTQEPAPVARQPTTQVTNASQRSGTPQPMPAPSPAPAQEIITMETPAGTVVTTKQVVEEQPQQPGAADNASTQRIQPSVKSGSTRSVVKSTRSKPQTLEKRPTSATFVTGDTPPQPMRPTVEETSDDSELPAARPVQTQPEIEVTTAHKAPTVVVKKAHPHHHHHHHGDKHPQPKPLHLSNSSSDWEQQMMQPKPKPNYVPDVRPQVDGDGEPWMTSFLDCFKNFNSCLLGCCCPCILFSKVEARHEDASLSKWKMCDGNAWLACLGNCVLPGAPMVYQRYKIRNRYRLKGNLLEDLVFGLCCPCCQQIHNDNETVAQLIRRTAVSEKQYSQRGAVMAYGTSSSSS